MTRVIRIAVLLVVALTLVMGPTVDAYAGMKDGQRGSVMVEKGPQFMLGASQPTVPAGSQPIESFPKWIGQYFALALFFFWLNGGFYYKT